MISNQISKNTWSVGSENIWSTSLYGTFSTWEWVHLGVAPLSMSKHLTPYEKFWFTEKCCANLKSCSKHYFKFLSFDIFIDLWVTWTDRGHCSSNNFNTFLWNGLSLDFTDSYIYFTVDLPNIYFMSSSF